MLTQDFSNGKTDRPKTNKQDYSRKAVFAVLLTWVTLLHLLTFFRRFERTWIR